MSAPGSGSFDTAEPCPDPSVLAFQRGDPTFGSGSPSDEFSEVGFFLSGGPPCGGSPWSGDGDGVNTEVFEFFLDRGFAEASISGDCIRWPTTTGFDSFDGRYQLWAVGRVPEGLSDRLCKWCGLT